MSLDCTKLEMVRRLADGLIQARCPACAADGGDRKGQHLRVYPDGRFGCCVYPKDPEHRKRIFALAGDRAPRGFTVKVAAPLATEPPRSIKDSLVEPVRTLRTPISKSESTESNQEELFRTLRTPFFQLRAYAKDTPHIYKDREEPVLSVLKPKLPYLTPAGDLRIPFDSPERYHWWKPPFEQRLRVKEIIAEILERKELDASPF